MSWSEFLNYSMNSGVNVIVGFLIGMTVDYIPKYETLTPKLKRLVFIALSFLVPVAALIAALTTKEMVFQSYALTIWPVIVSGSTAAFAGTILHTRKLK